MFNEKNLINFGVLLGTKIEKWISEIITTNNQ